MREAFKQLNLHLHKSRNNKVLMNLKANTKKSDFKKVWNSDGDGLANSMSDLYIFIQILIMKGVNKGMKNLSLSIMKWPNTVGEIKSNIFEFQIVVKEQRKRNMGKINWSKKKIERRDLNFNWNIIYCANTMYIFT